MGHLKIENSNYFTFLLRKNSFKTLHNEYEEWTNVLSNKSQRGWECHGKPYVHID